jgi:hypothetical protein
MRATAQRRIGRGLAVPIIVSMLGCAATQPVRVLAKGEHRWIASVGGPVLPNHVPTKLIPYTNLGVMYGRSGTTTVTGSVHLLAAAFGVAGIDVGAARRLRAQSGKAPELTGQAQLYGFAGNGGVRVYPNFTGTASWQTGPRTLLYGGSAATIRPSGGTTILVTPMLGVQQDVRRRFAIQLETKWMASNINMARGLFEGEGSVADRGSMAVQLGLQVKR